MKIVIRASELAAVAGRHPYKDQADAVREVVARCSVGKRKAEEVKADGLLKDVSVDAKLKSAKVLGVDVSAIEKAATLVEKEEKIKDLLPQLNVKIVKAVDQHSLAVAKKESTLLPALPDEVAKKEPIPLPALPEEVAPVVEQHMRMAVGTVEETSIFEKAREAFPDSIGEHAVAVSMETNEWPTDISMGCTSSGTQVYVTGICDALDRSRDTVFEIKRRRNRLFHRIPLYERVQLEAYMRQYKCLDGALIEYYPEEGVEMHWVERDDHLWSDVEVAVLHAFD